MKKKGAFLNHLQLDEYQELHHVLRVDRLLSDTDTRRTMIWSKFMAKHILHLCPIHTHTQKKSKFDPEQMLFQGFPLHTFKTLISASKWSTSVNRA